MDEILPKCPGEDFGRPAYILHPCSIRDVMCETRLAFGELNPAPANLKVTKAECKKTGTSQGFLGTNNDYDLTCEVDEFAYVGKVGCQYSTSEKPNDFREECRDLSGGVSSNIYRRPNIAAICPPQPEREFYDVSVKAGGKYTFKVSVSTGPSMEARDGGLTIVGPNCENGREAELCAQMVTEKVAEVAASQECLKNGRDKTGLSKPTNGGGETMISYCCVKVKTSAKDRANSKIPAGPNSLTCPNM